MTLRFKTKKHSYRWRYRDMFWNGGEPLSRTVILTWLGFQWVELPGEL